MGMIVAHQDFGGVPDNLIRALATNTSIKFAGGSSTQEARAMAGDMRASTEYIQNQPILSFATYIKGSTSSAISLKFDPKYFDTLSKRDDMAELIKMTHERYYSRFVEGGKPDESSKIEEATIPKRPRLTLKGKAPYSTAKPTPAWTPSTLDKSATKELAPKRKKQREGDIEPSDEL